MMDPTPLFCKIDDFWKAFEPIWNKKKLIAGNKRLRNRKSKLSESEIMTIVILFHHSHYRHLKAFYIQYVSPHLKTEFPNLTSVMDKPSSKE